MREKQKIVTVVDLSVKCWISFRAFKVAVHVAHKDYPTVTLPFQLMHSKTVPLSAHFHQIQDWSCAKPATVLHLLSPLYRILIG